MRPYDNPKPTLGFQRALQRAVFHVKTAGRLPVQSLNVPVAIFSEQESRAAQLLNEQGVTRLAVVNLIAHGTVKREGDTGDS